MLGMKLASALQLYTHATEMTGYGPIAAPGALQHLMQRKPSFLCYVWPFQVFAVLYVHHAQ